MRERRVDGVPGGPLRAEVTVERAASAVPSSDGAAPDTDRIRSTPRAGDSRTWARGMRSAACAEGAWANTPPNASAVASSELTATAVRGGREGFDTSCLSSGATLGRTDAPMRRRWMPSIRIDVCAITLEARIPPNQAFRRSERKHWPKVTPAPTPDLPASARVARERTGYARQQAVHSTTSRALGTTSASTRARLRSR